MSKFSVGDDVERIGHLVPEYMKRGIVTRVIPNSEGIDRFTEYEVNFGNRIVAQLSETQLRLATVDREAFFRDVNHPPNTSPRRTAS